MRTMAVALAAALACTSALGAAASRDKGAPPDRRTPRDRRAPRDREGVPDEGAESATHKEVLVIGETAETKLDRLTSLAITKLGNILACDAGRQVIRIITPEGKKLGTLVPGFAPYAIHIHSDGSIYVGGVGKLAMLDKRGNLVKTVDADKDGFPKAKASGMTTTGKDLFVSFGSGWSLRSLGTVVRFGLDFSEPKVIAQRMRGCCQRLDLAASDGVLYVAENARHRVVRMDREGKILTQWGKRARSGLDGFGACCNPMNLYFGPDGALYTSESGLARVKRYTAEGKFLGLVGYCAVPRFTRASGFAASCSNMAFAVSADGKRVFVQDVKKNVIRVLEKQ